MIHPLAGEFSEYLDGELPSERAALVERHVAECADCAGLLDDLRRVVARARALDDRAPRRDLWPGVAAAIGAGPSRVRRISVPVPLLAAAGLALALLSGGSVLLWQRQRGPVVSAGIDTVPAASVSAAATAPDRGYAGAVRALELDLARGRGRLDTVTVRVLEEKLALIDRAIGEAERALAADPANNYLAGHLIQTRMRKLDLLRRAAVLTRAVS